MLSNKIKILFTVPSADLPGGVANYYRIFKKYSSKRFDFFTIGSRSLAQRPWTAIIRLFQDTVLFRKTIITHPYKIIILNPSLDPKSLFRDGIHLFLAKYYKIKVIIFFRGWHLKWEKLIFDRLIWLFKFFFFKADAIITLAAEFKNQLVSLGYTGSIFLETTVVDDEAFQQDFKSGAYNYVHEGFQPHFKILFLSRIQKEKGIYEAIKAFQILKCRYPTVSLSIAGDGKELNRIIQHIEWLHLKDIEIMGYVKGKEKTAAFQEADIFLFPSSYGEGMPNAVLEAMAHGLPVITRPVGGIKDFFKEGKMGFLSDSLDPSIFAALMEKFIQDPDLKNAISNYNRNFAKYNFSSSRVMQRVEKICEVVLQNKPAIELSKTSRDADIFNYDNTL